MRKKTATERQSSALEARVRFIWGFAIGFCWAFVSGLWYGTDVLACLGIGLVVGLLFGILSRRWGDRFWRWLIGFIAGR